MSLSIYYERRQRLAAAMRQRSPQGGVAIIPTAPEVMRNRDSDYPYRHDSYFYYLTGFAEPEAVLVLSVTAQTEQAWLFCREKNVEREIWDGFRLGPEAAVTVLGIDQAWPVAQLDEQVPKLLANAAALFYATASQAGLDQQIKRWLDSVRALSRAGVSAPSAAFDVHALLVLPRSILKLSFCDLHIEQALHLVAAHLESVETLARLLITETL